MAFPMHPDVAASWCSRGGSTTSLMNGVCRLLIYNLLFMSELDRKMFLVRIPDMAEEIIKGTDAWYIIRGEATDDGI